MSEYEYIDLIINSREAIGFHGMNFIAFLFAYLVATYLVGERLSRFQVISLTMFYAITSPFPLMGMFESATDYSNIMSNYYETYRSEEPAPMFATQGVLLAPIVLSGAWFLSVLFMWQTRRIAKNAKAPPNKSLEPEA